MSAHLQWLAGYLCGMTHIATDLQQPAQAHKETDPCSPQALARKNYEEVCKLRGNDEIVSAVRRRMGLKCCTALDRAFICGFEQTASHLEQMRMAETHGLTPPPAPVAGEFQEIVLDGVKVIAYAPLNFMQAMYQLGERYQADELTAEQAIAFSQPIAHKLAAELCLPAPFLALNFLRKLLRAEVQRESRKPD
jgi:hypothetical protein